jgi:hypothetical protein
MLAWADVGHGGPFQTFPPSIAAELDADRATVRLLDPHSGSRAQLVPARAPAKDTEDSPAARARRASPACMRRGHSGPP